MYSHVVAGLKAQERGEIKGSVMVKGVSTNRWQQVDGSTTGIQLVWRKALLICPDPTRGEEGGGTARRNINEEAEVDAGSVQEA